MKKLEKSQVIEKFNVIHNNKYDYSLVEYVNCRTKIKIICPIHGVFEQSPDVHNKCGCSKCQNSTTEEFIIISNLVHNNKYNYSLVEYINNKTKVKIICPTHGVFEQRPHAHLQNQGCPKCFGIVDIYDFINKCSKIHDNKYDYSFVEYINCRTKIKIICPIHGVFEQRPDSHVKGCGCKKCKESKGSKKITKYLIDNNILHIKEYKYLDCKNILPLPFDFYLPDYNVCIEFDGRQHFESIKNWGGEKRLKVQQNHDKIKNEYCLNNNIRLIRIKYNENIYDKLSFIYDYHNHYLSTYNSTY